MKRSRVIISIILVLCVLATVPVAIMATGGEENHGGLTVGENVERGIYTGKDTYYADDNYRMDKNLSVIPVTVEAWVPLIGNR